MLSKLVFSRYRFHLEPEGRIRLPRFWQNTIRGQIGAHLRRLNCSNPMDVECPVCPVQKGCLYYRIFERKNTPWKKPLKENVPLPREYLITSAGPANPFQDEELPSVDLVLIGTDREDLFVPFVFAFQAMGKAGLGFRGKDGKRTRFSLHRVVMLCPDGRMETVFDRNTLCQGSAAAPLTVADFGNGQEPVGPNVASVKIFLETPLSIQRKDGSGKSRTLRPKELDFHELVKSLLWRLDLLHIYHCGGQTDYDYKALQGQAKAIRALANNPVYWKKQKRFSHSRSEEQMYDGIMGEMTFCGPGLDPYLPLLRVAEHLHIGKHTAFGNGAIRLRVDRDGAR